MSGSPLEAVRVLVEEAIRGFGLDPQKVRVKNDDNAASWAFRRGSADVVVSIAQRSSDTSTLRVAAPVLVPPDDAAKRAVLYEHLLKLNGSGLSNVAFGLLADAAAKVIVVSERPTEGLDQTEVAQMIQYLSAVADTYDDRLVEEFGGKRAADG